MRWAVVAAKVSPDWALITAPECTHPLCWELWPISPLLWSCLFHYSVMYYMAVGYSAQEMKLQWAIMHTKKCDKLQWQGCVSSLWYSEMKSWTREHRQLCAMWYRHTSSERVWSRAQEGRNTEPVKSPLPLLPARNRLFINKLSHFSCT